MTWGVRGRNPWLLHFPALLFLGSWTLDFSYLGAEEVGARCWQMPHDPWCEGQHHPRHPSGMVTFECPVGRWASPWAICFLLQFHLKGDAHQQVVGLARVEMQGECEAFC